MVLFYILLDIILYNLIVFSFGKNKKVSPLMVLLLIFVFLLFPYWSGDYFHLKESVEMAKLFKLDELSIPEELVYVELANILQGDYLLFRLIIWGGGLLLVCGALMNINAFNKDAICIFSIVSLLMFSYARVYVALALLFYCLTFFYTKKTISRWLILVLGCILSIVFHRSSVIMVTIVIFNIFFKPTKINLFLISIILLLSLVTIRTYLTNWALHYVEEYDSSLNIGLNRAYTYISSENKVVWSPSYILNFILTYIPLFYATIYFIKNREDIQRAELKVISELTNIYIYIIVTSIIMLIINIGTFVLFYRIANMVFIPLALIIGYFNSKNKHEPFNKSVLVLLFIWSNYALIYSLYNYLTL